MSITLIPDKGRGFGKQKMIEEELQKFENKKYRCVKADPFGQFLKVGEVYELHRWRTSEVFIVSETKFALAKEQIEEMFEPVEE